MPGWKLVFRNANNTFPVLCIAGRGVRYLGQGGEWYTSDLSEAIYYNQNMLKS